MDDVVICNLVRRCDINADSHATEEFQYVAELYLDRDRTYAYAFPPGIEANLDADGGFDKNEFAATRLTFRGRQVLNEVRLSGLKPWSEPVDLHSVAYIEVTVSKVLSGSRIKFTWYRRWISLQLFGRGRDERYVILEIHGPRGIAFFRVPAFDNAWDFDQPVTFGLLIDPVRATVAFRFNDIDGPCVRIAKSPFIMGVDSVTASHFPTWAQMQPHPMYVEVASPSCPRALLASSRDVDDRNVEELVQNGALLWWDVENGRVVDD